MLLNLLFITFVSISGLSKPLEDLRKTFGSKKGFEVEFDQQIKQDIFPDQPETATGHVKFMRPHHLIWVYKTPHKRVIEYDGEVLRIDSEPVRDSGQVNLQESFSFLWGQPNSEIFSIETKNPSTFRVTPKNPSKAGFKFIDVSVKAGLVSNATVKNLLEGDSVLHFRNWKLQN
ncbi:MAG: Outer-rane lipoprotein carrier protein [Bacteriovoracaceae bacterium]|nr:Outer-rane lipoprotein carrier protein [Bacteriovoracaceae bacterium]